MNLRPERSRDLPPGGAEPHLLPSGTNKIGRITQHSRELVDDLTDWIELKIKLTQLEVQEKIDAKINGVVVKALPVIFGALGGFFLLFTIAVGLGWLLGHPFWGFLIVTTVLLLTAAVLKSRSRQIADRLSGEHRIRVPVDAAHGTRRSARPPAPDGMPPAAPPPRPRPQADDPHSVKSETR